MFFYENILFILAAVCGYAVAGINPAIAISKAVYHKDIRECGSGNPGFTNFKRNFGGKWAWCVLAVDLFKATAVELLFALLLSLKGVDFRFGAAYTGIFCMLGHAFPFQFKFRGGKGFLVCLSTVWVIDWRAGLVATAILALLLLITKYMSVSTVVALISAPIMLSVFNTPLDVTIITAILVLFVAIRHKENFKRLFAGTESKFSFGKGKKQL